MLRQTFAVLALSILSEQAVHATLVVAVPVSDGLVACADRRLYNDQTGRADDTFVKIKKVNDQTLFVATNTVGFLDKATGKMEFSAFEITQKFAGSHQFGTPQFWQGLSAELRNRLLAYLKKEKLYRLA